MQDARANLTGGLLCILFNTINCIINTLVFVVSAMFWLSGRELGGVGLTQNSYNLLKYPG